MFCELSIDIHSYFISKRDNAHPVPKHKTLLHPHYIISAIFLSGGTHYLLFVPVHPLLLFSSITTPDFTIQRKSRPTDIVKNHWHFSLIRSGCWNRSFTLKLRNPAESRQRYAPLACTVYTWDCEMEKKKYVFFKKCAQRIVWKILRRFQSARGVSKLLEESRDCSRFASQGTFVYLQFLPITIASLRWQCVR